MLLHYMFILASVFLIFIWIGDFIQNAVGALIAFVLITLLYAVFAVPFVFFERKSAATRRIKKAIKAYSKTEGAKGTKYLYGRPVQVFYFGIDIKKYMLNART